MRVVIGIAAAVSAVGLPPAATAAWLLFGVVVGGLAGVWTWLTASPVPSPPGHSAAVDVAVRTGLLAGAAGITLGGTALALGPATPVAIVTATAALSVWMSARSVPGRRC